MTASPRWRKSSRSSQTANCVEIAHTLDQVRDSKNPSGPVVRADIQRLLTDLRAGRLA